MERWGSNASDVLCSDGQPAAVRLRRSRARRNGNRFDPNGRATRAQVAVILQRYMEMTDG